MGRFRPCIGSETGPGGTASTISSSPTSPERSRSSLRERSISGPYDGAQRVARCSRPAAPHHILPHQYLKNSLTFFLRHSAGFCPSSGDLYDLLGELHASSPTAL